MFVIVEKIIAALPPSPVVYTAVLTWFRRLELAQWTGEGLWYEFFIFGR